MALMGCRIKFMSGDISVLRMDAMEWVGVGWPGPDQTDVISSNFHTRGSKDTAFIICSVDAYFHMLAVFRPMLVMTGPPGRQDFATAKVYDGKAGLRIFRV